MKDHGDSDIGWTENGTPARADITDIWDALLAERDRLRHENERLRVAARTVGSVWRAAGPDAALAAAICDLTEAAGLREQG